MVLAKRALKNVRIKFMGKKVNCTALFDTGSGYTVVQRASSKDVSVLSG